ncbi:MAG: methylated-DNA--[protein]-cysteine S-methyltransferase, partial [Chloroflexota bacterium]|nr:methylated-DNA--[protein]-cysteine S-methyltransferase [Chloroflexota bacterium]
AAEEAGYRPCRRCRPHSRRPSRAERCVASAREYLEAHLDEGVPLERLGRAVGMSPHHLQRMFKRLTGVTPKEYADARRLERFRSRLKEGDTVSRATYEAGYGSGSRVYQQAHARLGMTPAAYRRGGRGMHIRFTIVDSPLGRLLVGTTERGICAVTLGDTDTTLEATLRREYPAASVERIDDGQNEWVATIVRHLSGTSAGGLDLPLDVQATAFQWRVWKALQEIPPGHTRTYGAIAAALGEPTAARAVASACASNPVAIVVPCHRVVRGDGDLGGYRWGQERKRQLLAREAAAGAATPRRSPA